MWSGPPVHKFEDSFAQTVSRDAASTALVFHVLSECALLLLAHNAPVKIKNSQGWSPLAEAISYGDRQMSKSAEAMSFREGAEGHAEALAAGDQAGSRLG